MSHEPDPIRCHEFAEEVRVRVRNVSAAANPPAIFCAFCLIPDLRDVSSGALAQDRDVILGPERPSFIALKLFVPEAYDFVTGLLIGKLCALLLRFDPVVEFLLIDAPTGAGKTGDGRKS